MPEIHIDLVEAGSLIAGFIFMFSHLKFESSQLRKELDAHKVESTSHLNAHKEETKKSLEDASKKHDDLSEELRDDVKAMGSALTDVKSALSRIEGILSVKNN